MSYAKGAARERQAQEFYRRAGWVVYRAAGSHGAADLICLKEGRRPLLVQVKRTKTPWSGFGPAERAELLEEALQAGATPLLLWWPADRRGPRELGPRDWPT